MRRFSSSRGGPLECVVDFPQLWDLRSCKQEEWTFVSWNHWSSWFLTPLMIENLKEICCVWSFVGGRGKVFLVIMEKSSEECKKEGEVRYL